MPPLLIFRNREDNPHLYAEVPGKNLGFKRANQLAGRKVGVTMPQDPTQFDPDRHIRDLGPLEEGEGTRRDPFIILPGFGEVDKAELQELAQEVRERNVERANQGDPSRGPGRDPKEFNQEFRDHLDRVIRDGRGKRTFGPGTHPPRPRQVYGYTSGFLNTLEATARRVAASR